MTIFATWQLRMTLDSICNSCDVFLKILKCLFKRKWYNLSHNFHLFNVLKYYQNTFSSASKYKFLNSRFHKHSVDHLDVASFRVLRFATMRWNIASYIFVLFLCLNFMMSSMFNWYDNVDYWYEEVKEVKNSNIRYLVLIFVYISI